MVFLILKILLFRRSLDWMRWVRVRGQGYLLGRSKSFEIWTLANQYKRRGLKGGESLKKKGRNRRH